MQIQSETLPKNAIQSYTTESVRVNGQDYSQSLLITAQELVSNLPLHKLAELHATLLPNWLNKKPRILIIGHQEPSAFLSAEAHLSFMKTGIGVESMHLDAACRTFNILLSEDREVALLLLFPN